MEPKEKFLKFNNFIKNKKFDNIFDFKQDVDVEWMFKYKDHFRKEYKNKIVDRDYDNDIEFSKIVRFFNSSKYRNISRLYKQLQFFNTNGCCSLIALSPLFLPPDELIYFMSKHFSTDKNYINKLLGMIVKNIISTFDDDKIIKNILRKAMRKNRKDKLMNGLNFNEMEYICNNIGLTLLIFEYDYNIAFVRPDKIFVRSYKNNDDFMYYPVLSTINCIKNHKQLHVEVCYDHRAMYECELYKERNMYRAKTFKYKYDEEKDLSSSDDSDYDEDNIDEAFKEIFMDHIKDDVKNRKYIMDSDDENLKMPNRRINRNFNNNNSRNNFIRNNKFKNFDRTRNFINNNRNNNRRNNINYNKRIVNMNKNKNNLNRINKNIKNNLKVNQPKSVNFKITNQNKNIIIRGKDLVVPITNDIIPDNGLYAIIPCNPAYWNSTRIKNIAILNQYYKPTKMIIEYVPSVSKFQKGNITIGTTSNMTMNNNDIQNMLIASTGGSNFSCSSSFTKNLQLSDLLQQNKFLISPKVDKESVPFYIVIYLSDVKDENNMLIPPGNFYINYEFMFFNPISKPFNFDFEQNILIRNFNRVYKNITLILTEVNGPYEIGSLIDVEFVGESYKFIYNGSEINLEINSRASIMYSVTDVVDQTYSIDLSNYNKHGPQADTRTIEAENFYIKIEPDANTIYILRVLQTTQVTIKENSYYKITPTFPDELKNIPITIYNYAQTVYVFAFYAYGYRVEYIEP